MSDVLVVAAKCDAAGRHEQAVSTLAAAAARGDAEAMIGLAKRLITGDRAPLLPTHGVSLLFDAMRVGAAEASLKLANLAALGVYMQQSWGNALEFLVFAAERGSQSARGQLCTLARQQFIEVAPAGGWRGITQQIDLAALLSPLDGFPVRDPRLIRAFPSLLTSEACDWLVGRARAKLQRALIYDPASAQDAVHHTRTNSVSAFDLMDADLVQIAMQHRMAATVGLPVHHMEAPTILHYQVGQQFSDHFDFVDPGIVNYHEEIARRGERVFTFLVYLNDDYAGGETDFRLLNLRYKGRRGEGLLFTNALPNGRPDTRMLHAGLPPTTGEKWIVSQFIRNRATLSTV